MTSRKSQTVPIFSMDCLPTGLTSEGSDNVIWCSMEVFTNSSTLIEQEKQVWTESSLYQIYQNCQVVAVVVNLVFRRYTLPTIFLRIWKGKVTIWSPTTNIYFFIISFYCSYSRLNYFFLCMRICLQKSNLH